MKIRLHRSADDFRDIAEPLYRRDPVGNTIELTLLRSNRLGDDALLVTIADHGTPVGAALQTPPYPLACNGIPNAANGALAIEVARIRPELNGARGSRDATMPFAEAWHAVTGQRGRVTTEERLYRLGALQRPSGVSGGYRDATDADLEVLIDWVERFFVETFSHHRDRAAGRRFVESAKAAGDRFVLWDDGGTPVSMAMLRAPAAGVSRIGPVFTPRGSRGRGYGSAVTAAASELARRDRVGEVVLFADLANPISNGIYQAIGFEAVTDSVRVEFSTEH
ncbi:GNAT family N-acetyltransferase [Mycobacterium sp. ITM-2016-00318]|uniref:GNAT family N-acetyltransferase n=1 Tax=Mycobacterium sp. ITM-2016-00318 TaxID=2099693 RepID=UPI000CF9B5E8|nr:GNAT family N-acetyltransferase [Mycobacterium sp. ITM-2016-00318]WNG90715.1 GNAT family N-acetyltransferase [Mycobacterium sp. ITM-2016-00318]